MQITPGKLGSNVARQFGSDVTLDRICCRQVLWQKVGPHPAFRQVRGSLNLNGSSRISGIVKDSFGINFTDVLSPGGGLSLSMDEGFDSDDVSDRDSSDEGTLGKS